MPISEARKSELREAILNIAIQEFLAQGYTNASVDTITRKAGGSKTNIYVHFGGKEGLFFAAIETLCIRLLSPLRSIPLVGTDVRDVLYSFGIAFLDATLSEEAIGLIRLVIAETPRFPKIAKMFLNAGPVFAQETLAAYLDSDPVRKVMKCDIAGSLMSTLFIDMISRDQQLRLLLVVGSQPTTTQKRAIVKGAISLILHENDGHPNRKADRLRKPTM